MPMDGNSEYWDTLRLSDEESAAEALATARDLPVDRRGKAQVIALEES